jgi:plasmid stabilization system protein ParE
MPRIVRSPLAKRDILVVLSFTKDQWGINQAREYSALIREALRAIGADPARGKARDDIVPGIFAHHISQRGRPARHRLLSNPVEGNGGDHPDYSTMRWISRGTFRRSALNLLRRQTYRSHPKVIEAYLRNLLTLLEAEPARGREILSCFVAPIVMTPQVEGPVRR